MIGIQGFTSWTDVWTPVLTQGMHVRDFDLTKQDLAFSFINGELYMDQRPANS